MSASNEEIRKELKGIKDENESIKGEVIAIKDLFTEIKDLVIEHKGISEENNFVAKNTEKVAQDTNKEAHTTKHETVDVNNKIKGFTDASITQFKRMELALERLDEFIEKSEKKEEKREIQAEEITHFIKALQAAGTISAWQNILKRVDDSEKFKDKFSTAAFLLGVAGGLVAVAAGSIALYQKIASFFTK